LAALAAGKHVMCQKPLTLDRAEAERMVAEADARGLRLAVNQNVRYTPANQSIADWLATGQIGRPHAATIEYHARFAYDPWRAQLPHMALTDGALHHIDLMRWWFGTPRQVFAAETAVAPDQPATYATLIARYDDGLVVTLICDWASPAGRSSFDIAIHAAGGVIEVTGSQARCYRVSQDSWTDGRTADPAAWKPGVGFLPAFADCMAGFLHAIETDQVPPTSAVDNLGTLDILFAAHRSIETGRAVDLPARATTGGRP
jgi:predicted dehydrogenase